LKTILIEDDDRNRKKLSTLLARHCPNIEIVAMATDVSQGVEAIAQHKPELVLLDIQLPGGTGFDLLQQLPSLDFSLVFVTAHDQYAIRAFKFSAIDYLLKPVNAEALVEAVSRASVKETERQRQQQLTNLLNYVGNKSADSYRLVVSALKEKHFLRPADIVRCEADNCYTKFFLATGESILSSRGIFEYEKLLEPYRFVRCHQSHLVNLNFVRSMRTTDSITELVLANGDTVPVSRLKKELVTDQLARS
jgi:two-component system LytT family response regulator